MPTYHHKFAVQSKFSFPLDMLRYDGCYPRGSDDAAEIFHSINREGEGSIQVRTIWLNATKNSKTWKPTEGRWDSFLWVVIKGSHEVRREES